MQIVEGDVSCPKALNDSLIIVVTTAATVKWHSKILHVISVIETPPWEISPGSTHHHVKIPLTTGKPQLCHGGPRKKPRPASSSAKETKEAHRGAQAVGARQAARAARSTAGARVAGRAAFNICFNRAPEMVSGSRYLIFPDPSSQLS
jgi:hypothetical protein